MLLFNTTGLNAIRTFFDTDEGGGTPAPAEGDTPASQQAAPPAGDPPPAEPAPAESDKPEAVQALEAANAILAEQYKEMLNGAPKKLQERFGKLENPLHERIPQLKAAMKEHEELRAALRDEVQIEVQQELDTKYGKGLIDVKKGPIIKADAPPAVSTGPAQNSPGEQTPTKHKLMDPETLNSFGDWDNPHAIHQWGLDRANNK